MTSGLLHPVRNDELGIIQTFLSDEVVLSHGGGAWYATLAELTIIKAPDKGHGDNLAQLTIPTQTVKL